MPQTIGTNVRRAAAAIASPIQRILAIEAASGIVLLVATAAALIWANVWTASYRELWHVQLQQPLEFWVNDGLMTVFFFVVGLEIRREISDGALASIKQAALPLAAAVGGMLVPAGIFAASNIGRAGAAGWGVPMATDIAFAVGVLTLLGPRIPPGLRILLLALAVVDDIGAIVVIALFYSGGVGGQWLLLAALTLLVFVLCWRLPSPWRAIALVPCAVTAWFFVHKSGVHPTIAGALLGLLVPATAQTPDTPAERLAHVFHPWTSFVIVPLFALANAGIALGSVFLPDALAAPVVIGIVLGLVLGKFIGIGGTVLLLTRLGIAGSPGGATRGELLGVAALGGIGFTVSLFITQLAFVDPATEALAKLGVFTASVVAALLGVAILRLGPMRRRR